MTFKALKRGLVLTSCVFGLFCASSPLSYAQLLTGFADVEEVPSRPVSDPVVRSSPSSVTVFSLDEPGALRSGVSERRFVQAEVERVVPELRFESVSELEAVSVSVPEFASGSESGSLSEPRSASAFSGQEAEEQPVDLQADDLSYSETGERVTATGNVILEQAGRILRADVVNYDVAQDRVIASGNVVLNDTTGDIYLADGFELKDQLKDGMVRGLKATLADGSRFTARDGERQAGLRTVMKGASYTACKICEEEPEKPPVWRIKAAEVVHDKEARNISYKHARFEIFGAPVFYTPYLSHSDGSVDRQSGFLSPSGGFNTELGAFATTRYYWDVAPDKDATIGLTAFTLQAPLLEGQWRQRWNDASLVVDTGVTYSDRIDDENGVAVQQDDEFRGHVFAEALWDVNDKWRAGARVNLASDDQYLRQYNLDTEDVLENEVFAERFSGRNYAVGRVLTFQDIRVDEDQEEDQPQVLPEIVASFVGDAGAVPVIGGRWDAQASLLGLRREGNDQDLNRLSLDLGWKRRLISDTGLVTDTRASVRGDVYNIRDRDESLSASGGSSTETRLFPQLHVQSAYPVAKRFTKSQLTVEPVVALTFAPNVSTDDIPNEDSQDVQIDASNLFEANRFPGLDIVEDESRVTYGGRVGVYGDNGDLVNVFLGQSRRLGGGDNLFPAGSGLDEQESDIVGQVRGIYGGHHRLDYRFQLDQDGFASQRHEVDVNTRLFNRLDLDANYLFAEGLEGTDLDTSREQFRFNSTLDVTDVWAVRAGGTQDLGEDPGLRTAYAGVDYKGQCFSWSLIGQRNLTDEASGDSDTEILFRIGLKNLGEFESLR